MRRSTLIAVAMLVVGLLAGWFGGRCALERRWSEPLAAITPDAARRSAEGNADPTPAAGTRVMQPMPLQRSRAAMRELVANDPVVMSVGAVGRDDSAIELHLTLRNRGRCTVTEVEGVAYGFDAWGQPSKLNRAGEHYVAFRSTGLDVAPGASTRQGYPLRHPETASLALAQVERVTCADGTRWARR
ncbi:MAG: hypothetical protein WCJ30_12525 [Deltaproteobacteria bacterium]